MATLINDTEQQQLEDPSVISQLTPEEELDRLSRAPVSERSVPPTPEKELNQLQGPDTVGPTGTPIEERSFSTGDVFQELIAEESNEVFQMLDEAPVSISTAFLDKRALDLTAIKARIDPLRDRYQLMRESILELSGNMTQEEVFETYQQEAANQASQFSLDAIEQSLQLEDGATEEEVIKDVGIALSLPKKYSGLLGEQQLFVDNHAPLTFDEGVKAEIAAADFTWAVFSQFSESLGIFDKYGSSLLGLLLLPDFIKDANDLVGGDFIDTGDALKELVSSYQSLPTGEKPQAFVDIFERSLVAFESNPWKVAGLVSLLNSPEVTADVNLEVVLGAFDAISLGADLLPIRTIRGIAGATRKQQQLKAAGDTQGAAEAPLTSPDSVFVAGDSVDKANTANAFDLDKSLVGVGSQDGLSAEGIKLKENIAKNIENNVEAPMEVLVKENKAIDLTSLNATEKEQATANFWLFKQAEATEKGVLFTNATIKSSDEGGFVAEYLLDGVPTVERREWLRSDVGTFDAHNPDFLTSDTPNRLFNFFASADTKLATVDPDIVNEVTFGGLQASIIQKQLTTIAKELNKKVDKDTRLAVDELLVAGDQMGEVFSLADLRSGTKEFSSGKRVYNDKEISHYYEKLAFTDELWKFRNGLIREELLFKGAVELRTTSLKTPDVTNKKIILPKSDFRNVDFSDTDLIYAPQLSESGVHLTVSQVKARLDDLKEQGYLPARIVNDYTAGGNKKVKWALFKDEGKDGRAYAAELPMEVLNRQKGYQARIYTPGYYFIKANGQTLRAAKSLKEAKEWIREFHIDQEAREVPASERLNPEPFRDRQLNKLEAISEDANQYGGLYDGPRKKDLLRDTEGNPLDRLNWGDSTQRYINSVSEEMPLNKYKLSLIERFNNSVDTILKRENPDKGWHPDDWKTADLSVITDANTRKAMENTRTYILDQFKISSNEERTWNTFMMDVAEGMEGSTGSNALQRTAITLAHKDPIKQMKGATFNTMMGWYNPRHLYIQMQNASLAVAHAPRLAAKNALKTTQMVTLINLSEENVAKWAKTYSKMPFSPSAEELIQEVKDFKRAGMQSSILRNADIQASTQGITGGTKAAVLNVARKGLVFYEYGETVSRIAAWNIAKSKWKEANPGKVFDDQGVKDVTRETFRMNLNMQKENSANFQNNKFTANALQFLQVQTKFSEKVVGGLLKNGDPLKGQWTRAEAGRALAGQLFFYGALGVPIVQSAVEYGLEYLGTDPVQLKKDYPLIQEGINDGFTGMLFELAGFENSFGGDTSSLLAGMDNNILWALGQQAAQHFAGRTTEKIDFTETVVGPSLTFASRSSDAIINTVKALGVLYRTPTLETVGNVAFETIDDIGSITSTWSNASKILLASSYGGVFSKKGDKILSMEQLSGQTLQSLVAATMGIPLEVYTANYSLMIGGKDRQRYLRDVQTSVKKAQVIYMGNGNEARYTANVAHLLTGLSDLEKRNIMKNVVDDVLGESQKTQLDKQLSALTRDILRAGGRLPIPLGAGDVVTKEAE